MESPQKHKMGTLQLTIITVVNMMGSGIIMLPAQLAGVGNITIISWVLTSMGAMALAYGFAKCGRYSKNIGGMGGYAQYAFGKSGNMLANYTYAIAIVIANVGVAISAVGYFCKVVEIEIGGMATALWTMFFIWLTTLPNFWSSKITGKIGTVTVWGVIIPVIGIIFIGWFWFKSDIYIDGWNPHHLGFFDALPQALALTMWAFLGLESASANSDAVENPEKSVPIAVLGGTLFTAVIYILSTAVIGGIIPYETLAVSSAPFGLVYSHMFGGGVGKFIEVIMCIACLGSLLTWQFTTGQVFKSCADVGYFFKIFGRVTKRGAPVVGLIIICVIQSVFLLMSITPSFNREFNVIVDFSVVVDLVPYILSMSACSTIIKSSDEYKAGKISHGKLMLIGVVCFLANAYTLYAMYSAGSEALIYGALVTFAGWIIFGRYMSSQLNISHPSPQKSVTPE
ncbi:putrescine-ornithine antiporter [Pseudomonas sp.]|uniref:putrescine-ornithine antiporter n=1 Tax=Pseudomonas sp. TaxID=306 RepID=UPI0026291AE3|nr:putrescine-ornithine antiporter [Pseudomonas sp.]